MSTALFSPCRTWRYELRRHLGALAGGRPLAALMLNPSTADETKNDPTIRRVIRFAEREGASELIVVNLYALRSTNPRGLLAADDPVGPENDAAIARATGEAGTVLCAWGAFTAPFHDARVRRVLDILRDVEANARCLGVTASGAPRHPLYVAANTPLQPLRTPGAAEKGGGA